MEPTSSETYLLPLLEVIRSFYSVALGSHGPDPFQIMDRMHSDQTFFLPVTLKTFSTYKDPTSRCAALARTLRSCNKWCLLYFFCLRAAFFKEQISIFTAVWLRLKLCLNCRLHLIHFHGWYFVSHKCLWRFSVHFVDSKTHGWVFSTAICCHVRNVKYFILSNIINCAVLASEQTTTRALRFWKDTNVLNYLVRKYLLKEDGYCIHRPSARTLRWKAKIGSRQTKRTSE